MIEDYGRESGYGQIAPGRDTPKVDQQKKNGRPRQEAINTAILGGLPAQNAVFKGAEQSVGAVNAPSYNTGGWEATVAKGGVNGGTLSVDGQPSTPANPSWNTDGFSAPGYTAQNFGNAMGGWDQSKWADTNHQTPKYAVGRILQESGAPSIENLGKALQNIQQAYPGATFNGKDKITIPGVGTFDVLTNSGSGQGMQWAWQPVGGEGGGNNLQGMANPMASAIMGTVPNTAMGGDYATRIREQVMQALRNQPVGSLAGIYGN